MPKIMGTYTSATVAVPKITRTNAPELFRIPHKQKWACCVSFTVADRGRVPLAKNLKIDDPPCCCQRQHLNKTEEVAVELGNGPKMASFAILVKFLKKIIPIPKHFR